MRRAVLLLAWLAAAAAGCDGSREGAPAADPCAVAPIEQGYGAPGPWEVASEELVNPGFPEQRLVRFLPRGAPGPVPVVLLAHAFNEGDPERYRGLVGHLVGRGYAVVFPAYEQEEGHAARLDALSSGLAAALEAEATPALDASRLALVGHSYGGGALPTLAARAGEAGRGSEALALAFLAPWYAVEDDALAEVPAHAKALFMVFEDDTANDHRIAKDLHARLSLPEAAKDYVLVRSDAHAGCTLPALHTLPMSEGLRAGEDALDVWALRRLLDALFAYAFEGDAAAAKVALGRGSPEQVRMGAWPDGTEMLPLLSGAAAAPSRPSSEYLFAEGQRARWLEYGASR